jgi:hypothetical protein
MHIFLLKYRVNLLKYKTKKKIEAKIPHFSDTALTFCSENRNENENENRGKKKERKKEKKELGMTHV